MLFISAAFQLMPFTVHGSAEGLHTQSSVVGSSVNGSLRGLLLMGKKKSLHIVYALHDMPTHSTTNTQKNKKRKVSVFRCLNKVKYEHYLAEPERYNHLL